MQEAQVSVKESLVKIIDEMPEDKIAEALDFALFLNSKKKKEETSLDSRRHIELKTGSIESLQRLAGIVDWEGDAVVDGENYWD